MIEKLFHVREAGSTPGREALGGATTFLTMAYIVFVNPQILSAAGIPVEGAITATCLSAAFGTLLMAFLANYPIAVAPGMGMNAFFAFTLCGAAGVAWPAALGLVFWSAVIFLVLTLSGARRVLVLAVPPVIKLSGAAGIGLFIAFIGFKEGGIVVDHPQTLVGMGNLASKPALLTLLGLGSTLILMALKVRTAIFWGLAATAVAAMISGAVGTPSGIVALPTFDLPGFQIDLWGAFRPQNLVYLLVILFFDVFDTMGTLMGVAHEGGFLKEGELPRMDRAMTSDAGATLAGSLFGTSPVTSYIESGTGVAIGARTGLASVVTGALFLVALFFSPLAKVVGAGTEGGLHPVTAPALIVVGTLMVKAVREIDWGEMTEALPAFFTMILMPLTFNISHGLAAGILVYVVVKLAARRFREVHWLMIALAAAFVGGYALLAWSQHLAPAASS